MMDAWIDTRGTALAGGTGIATYAEGLARTVTRMGGQVDFLSLLPTGRSRQQGQPGKLVSLACIIKALCPAVRIKQDGVGHPYLPFMFRMGNTHFRVFGQPLCLVAPRPPQVMHWTYPLPLKLKNTINITTIHDIIPITHPDLTGINKEKMQKILLCIINNSDYIICVTEYVRRKIIEYFHIPENRIKNLYQCAGISKEEVSLLSQAEAVAPADAFVCVGRVESRKNIRRLIIAHGRSGTKRPLVIMGPDGDDRPDLTPVHGRQKIVRVPWCARHSLLRAIAEARALLFPSLGEGFGLPIIEAMSLDTPVMTSAGGATEEVAGNAAMLVDPLDIDQMSRVIQRLDEMDTETYKALAVAGQERAQFFSLDMQVKRMTEFYNSIGVTN
ncbi:glycosyltransferase family 1 protein [Komagataeibacter medellinensis]|uniref:Glycosyltransferase family 1 protein n=1 Tax=Komagataeibacter medellinensis TaxID=1177712 RepID=A0ABQ6VUS4_9PROT|nr:glycosyltransferase family 1 protein [Komagataeibacter medellinensis]KAB8123956.1 glycosyltransferase family 1 protein [Komagataeibacter medellinensis]